MFTMSNNQPLTPRAVLATAHRILKSLHAQLPFTQEEHTPAALHWLEQGSFVQALLDEAGEMQYEITQWGLDALLGRRQ